MTDEPTQEATRNIFVRMREESGLRQVDVATAASASGIASIPRSLVHELEHGTRKEVGARKLYAIAHALGVRMETLLELPALPGRYGPTDLEGARRVTYVADEEMAALLAARDKYGWIEEDVMMLMGVHFRQRRPTTADGWWFIYESVRRAVTQL